MMNFHQEAHKTTGARVEVSQGETTGFMYNVHNKWDLPRGQGFAVFVTGPDGKSMTGNTAAFYSKSFTSDEARAWCAEHNDKAAAA
jgi:hypothetical protein